MTTIGNDGPDTALIDLNAAMEPTRRTLGYDGYGLHVMAAVDGRVVFQIEALEGACPECLSPDEVMGPLFLRQLAKSGHKFSTAEILRPSGPAHDA